MEKLKSRKLWMAVIGAFIVIANDGLGLGLDAETIKQFAQLVIGYIIGQGGVDVAIALKKKG